MVWNISDSLGLNSNPIQNLQNFLLPENTAISIAFVKLNKVNEYA